MTTIWDNVEKSGNNEGWEYDESNLLYDSEIDPDGSSKVYYNSIGVSTSITNTTKH